MRQMSTIRKMGPMREILSKMPVIGGMLDQIPAEALDDSEFDKVKAIIDSMTHQERKHPDVMNPSRMARVARGCGRPEDEVADLHERFLQARTMMKGLGSMFGDPRQMAQMQQMMGGMGGHARNAPDAGHARNARRGGAADPDPRGEERSAQEAEGRAQGPQAQPAVSSPVTVIRAPNHLGDAVMALPAIEALARRGPVSVQGPAFLADLIADPAIRIAPVSTMDRRVQQAILLAPSLGAALAARRAQRRIGTPTDGRRWLLTDPIAARIHRSDTYAAIARAAGGQVRGRPRVRPRPGPCPDVPEGHIGLNPVVGGTSRSWAGFSTLAARLGRPVVFYGGPGEADRVARVAGDHRSRVGLGLPDFARALSRCAVFVSNDSGAAHFAAAVGTPVVVVHGSTTPAATGPAGSVAIRGRPAPCAPCYRADCFWPGAPPCLDIAVDEVLDAIAGVVGG